MFNRRFIVVSTEPRLHAALVSLAKVMHCIQCYLVEILRYGTSFSLDSSTCNQSNSTILTSQIRILYSVLIRSNIYNSDLKTNYNLDACVYGYFRQEKRKYMQNEMIQRPAAEVPAVTTTKLRQPVDGPVIELA